jgi:predicted transcriptional regulator
MSVKETLTKKQFEYYCKNEFQRAGYCISDDNIRSNAFDFIAQRKNPIKTGNNARKIVTKILVDLDLFKKQASIELQLISKLISGFPLLVAQSAAGKNMDEAALYRRHDISAISLDTLKMYLRYEKISKYAGRGGIYVKISKDELKKRRKLLKLDLTFLARKIGLSRHSLYKYEKGESLPKIENYKLLTKVLGDNLDEPIEVLSSQFNYLCENTLRNYVKPHSKLQEEVTQYLEDIEVNVLWFKSEPFDGLSAPSSDFSSSNKNHDTIHPIITGVTSCDDKTDSVRISSIESLSKFLQKKAVWFIDENLVDYNSIKSLGHLTIVNISDLEHMADKEFKDLLKKRESSKSSLNQITK